VEGADRIVVLRAGAVAGELTGDDVSESALLSVLAEAEAEAEAEADAAADSGAQARSGGEAGPTRDDPAQDAPAPGDRPEPAAPAAEFAPTEATEESS
jgi:ribose transport system ATP-binding protein